MMIRRVWIKSIGENASIAITGRGKRRVTLPNCATYARPPLLRRAKHLFVLSFSVFDGASQGFPGRMCGLASMIRPLIGASLTYQGNHLLMEEEKLGATVRAAEDIGSPKAKNASKGKQSWRDLWNAPDQSEPCEATFHNGGEGKYEDSAGRATDGERAAATLWRH